MNPFVTSKTRVHSLEVDGQIRHVVDDLRSHAEKNPSYRIGIAVTKRSTGHGLDDILIPTGIHSL